MGSTLKPASRLVHAEGYAASLIAPIHNYGYTSVIPLFPLHSAYEMINYVQFGMFLRVNDMTLVDLLKAKSTIIGRMATDKSAFQQGMDALLAKVESIRGKREYERLVMYLIDHGNSDIYQGITRQPFYERETFPWVKTVESAFPTIQKELLSLRGQSRFTKYDQPFNENKNLYLGSWNTFNFYHANQRFDDNCRICPETAAVLDELACKAYPLPGIAKFSALAGGSHIRPHSGYGNYMLRCHLGLICPGTCEIRVNREIRSWKEGECLILDDSLEHEVWNRGDAVRIILLFDFWHPEVTLEEIDCIRSVFNLMRFLPNNVLGKWQKSQEQMERALDASWWGRTVEASSHAQQM